MILRKKSGFSTVEIIFVLAIGAMILLMSIFAIRGMRASQRDGQRKADFAKINQGMIDWANKNDGKYPDFDDPVKSGRTVPTNDIDLKNQYHYDCTNPAGVPLWTTTTHSPAAPTILLKAWTCDYAPVGPNSHRYWIYSAYSDDLSTKCDAQDVYDGVIWYQYVSDRSYKMKICLESGSITEDHSL